ncbi:MAG: YgaP family membrane protein [Acidiferrobacter sp.]
MMFYIKNVPWQERWLRMGLGVGVATYALTRIGGTLGWIIVVGAGVLLLTGVLGFCPACALAGRRLEKRTRNQ